MNKHTTRSLRLLGAMALAIVVLLPTSGAYAQHDIRGITGPTFDLYAYPFNMDLPDGTSLYMWGFGDMGSGASATHPEGNG